MVLMLRQFGTLEDMVICGNKMDHLSGNLLAMFREMDAATAAFIALNDQFYAGRRISISFAPVLRLSCSICRGFEDGTCALGNSCGFVHPLYPSQYISSLCFPRGIRAFAEPFRKSHRTRITDTPADVLYGRTKRKFEEYKKEMDNEN
ncbi:Splicing factor U2af small subunit B [Histomonas meleagridis]|uniref:Splicing factor U2af small subunit B n=1 Tax=Histomonas meleagridis TaxID=135588 RepID=UPI00355A4CB3|nr:Splicing factor U2af small subunit B [Histomonas meleagridis]KAH0804466.1 Splicing factor U2af small subunit B [Histomonas meleagridis]